ncbi:MAG: ribonuclease H [Thermoprotei archaeon]|nr:MAG: ribonuclease H [Thermoprotei archaeon]
MIRDEQKNNLSKSIIKVYVDGCCEPVNPGGIAAYGFVVYKNGEKIYEECGIVGVGALGDDVSNNVAEYVALIKALEYLLRAGLTDRRITVMSDSQLIVRQIRGEYSVRAPRLIMLHRKATELLNKFIECRVEWIPREMNEEADSLSKKAYLQFVRENESLVRKYYGRYFASRSELELLRMYGISIDYPISKVEARKLLKRILKKRYGVDNT